MLVGLSGEEYADPVAFVDGYRRAILVCAGPLAAEMPAVPGDGVAADRLSAGGGDYNAASSACT